MSERPRTPDASTIQQPRLDPSDPSQTSFVLEVIEGPDRGARLTVDGSLAMRPLVGQSPACSLRLSDPRVSRRHLALELVPPRLRIVDLDSTNGTYVDGVAVVNGYLSGGELVRIGATAVRVARGLAPRAENLPAQTGFGRLLGVSDAMRKLYPLCERLATSAVPVVIEGETGTGKELLAEVLHELGPRVGGPFVVFDCTAVPPNLIESELFGQERGALGGAGDARRGVFEQAHGGTLFIDEIGELELSLQSKLLRCIERFEVRRLGSERSITVDVRIIAATRRDLDGEVQAGRFRDDLFHRLMVARIELPPLRHRTGDVPLLVRHFWSVMGGSSPELTDELVQRFERHDWPGNVRELRNAVARRIALGELAAVDSRRSPPLPAGRPHGVDFVDTVLDLPFSAARRRVVENFEQRYVEHIVAAHHGNVSHAAATSGLALRYFQLLRAKGSK